VEGTYSTEKRYPTVQGSFQGPRCHRSVYIFGKFSEQIRPLLSHVTQSRPARGICVVSDNRYHARQAAVVLLKMAQATADPTFAAKLVDRAADLKDRVGELPPPAETPQTLREEG
jgi:hypothetical protein